MNTVVLCPMKKTNETLILGKGGGGRGNNQLSMLSERKDKAILMGKKIKESCTMTTNTNLHTFYCVHISSDKCSGRK